MALKAREKDGGATDGAHAGGPVVVWFRNDLRVRDNLALSKAVASGAPIIALFILDETAKAPRKLGGARRWWLHHSLVSLKASLAAINIPLVLRRGETEKLVRAVVEESGAGSLFWNRRYEPAGIAIDTRLKASLKEDGIHVESFDGQLLHEPNRTATGSGGHYKVYTPFWRALDAGTPPRDPIGAPDKAAKPAADLSSDTLDDWKLLPTKPDWSGGIAESWKPGEAGAWERLEDFISGPFDAYAEGRDLPDRVGTSRMSPHLAFGEITPYQIWAETSRRPKEVASEDRTTYRKEIVWREFSYHLLYHKPDLAEANYNAAFDAMPWRQDKDGLRAWQRGMTGYPIVDAGMRELWQTGWMHNRVRMIVASFLTKHLLIDWRIGEDWFWDTLVDADPASNAAQWQWVAGSGADAAPYFRIFNPMLQGSKFDKKGDYVRRFVPELAELPDKYIQTPWEAPSEILTRAGIDLGKDYPRPIVDHQKARQRALDAYKKLKEAA